MRIQSIEDLYWEKSQFILRYLLKIGCPKEDAEDILQNTFLKAVEHMIHLNIGNPSAWLFRVSINNYYDLCRKRKRHPSAQVDEKFFENMQGMGEDGEQIVLKKENKRDIEAILNQLPATQSNLLLLKYELDLSYEEISILLNIKVDTIRMTLYRARNNFKQKWSEFLERQS